MTTQTVLGRVSHVLHHPMTVRAAKSAVAAGLAFLAGGLLPEPLSGYNYYAAMGAFSVVLPAIADSLAAAARTTLAILLGIAVAVALQMLTSTMWWSVGVAIGLAVVVSALPVLRAEAEWVPLVALFVLAFGGEDPRQFVLGYVVQVPLGALIGIIERRLAEESETAELGVHLSEHGDRVFVTGQVASEASRRAVLDRVAALCPGQQVVDQLTCAEGTLGDPPGTVGGAAMIRVAAVGDVHLGPDLAGRHRAGLHDLSDRADVLLLAGDLTRHGTVAEARVVAAEYRDLPVPVVAVLGNHDYHDNAAAEVTAELQEAGLVVLEGEGVVLELPAGRLGVAGVKGFGLGFAGRCASDFGEPEMKEFTRTGRRNGELMAQALSDLGESDPDVTVALTHYSPVDETLVGEPPEIWPFLGNYLLGQSIDEAGADLAVHGHAHAGTEKGSTDGGVRVRNVAQPVIRAAYAVYDLHPREVRPAAASAG